MPGKVNVFNLGEKGVNINKSPIHLDDGELTLAQNAAFDPEGGEGGLKKRAGLAKVNGVAASAAVGAFIGVQLLNQRASGGATRTLFRNAESAAGASAGWDRTTDITTGWPSYEVGVSATNPTNARAAGRTLVDFGFVPALGSRFPGTPSTQFANTMIYAGDDYTLYPAAGHTAPTIRLWDRPIDRELCRIPYSIDVGAGTNAKSVLAMITVGSLIYLSTFDGGTTTADRRGRVFQLDPVTGDLTQLGASFPAGYLPYALCWHMGRLWVGTAANDLTFAGRVYYFRVGVDSAWTLDHTTTAAQGDITALVSYRGDLYAMTTANAPNAALVKKRTTSTAVWSNSDTGPVVTAGNHFNGGVVFNDAIYTCHYDPTNLQTLIRKYDGAAWSTVATVGGGGAQASTIPRFVVDSGVIFALSYFKNGVGTDGQACRTSPDGTTWTSRATTGGGSIAFGAIGA